LKVSVKMDTSFHTGLTVKNKFGKNTPIYSIEEVKHKKLVTDIEIAEREDRELMEAMKASRAKVALLKANADIVRLRGERDEVEALEEAKYDIEINRLISLRHDVRVKREALRRGERDGELTAVSVARATDFVVTTRDARPVARMRPEGTEPRTKTKIDRPPLAGLIKSRTFFKFPFKGVDYMAYSDNGHKIVEADGSRSYDTVSEWANTKIKATGDQKTQVSPYERVYAKLNHCPNGDPWRKWGVLHCEGAISIN
jgi:hypothetical protein